MTLPGLVRKTGLLLAAAGIITAAGMAVPSATSATTYNRLQNDSSAGCIQQTGSSATDESCSASASQYWALQATSKSGYYKLVNKSSGKCIEATLTYSGVSVVACAAGDGDQTGRNRTRRSSANTNL